jgi:hypothetical protein
LHWYVPARYSLNSQLLSGLSLETTTPTRWTAISSKTTEPRIITRFRERLESSRRNPLDLLDSDEFAKHWQDILECDKHNYDLDTFQLGRMVDWEKNPPIP